MLGPLGGGEGDAVLVGDLLVVLDGVGEAVGGDDGAVDEGVLVLLVQADVLRLPLELGPGEGGEEVHRGVHIGARGDQPFLHLAQFLLGGGVGEPADGQGDGVGMPPPDHRAQVAGELLDPQGPLHHLSVGLDQGDDRVGVEEVGGDQVVGVEDVAVDDLPVEVQLAQEPALLGEFDAEGLLRGPEACGGVADGADAADAGGDVAQLVVGAAAHEGLEEAWRFDHLEAAFLDLAVLDVHDDVAVALNPCDVVNFDFHPTHSSASNSR